MKKLTLALAAFACLATPALANGIRPPASPTGPTREEIAAEARREAAVPAATLKGLKDRWAEVTKIRSASSQTEQAETFELSTDTQRAVQAADTARRSANRAEFKTQSEKANTGMEDMCDVLSGC